MFDELDYDTSFEYRLMKISYDPKIIGRVTNICELYMLNGSTINCHASVATQDSHGNSEICSFDLRYLCNMNLVVLAEQAILDDGTELKMLETNNGLDLVS